MKLHISDDLSLPLDVTTQALAWLGRRGSGKSYGASKLAELLHERNAQFVAIDPVGIWYGLRLAADGKSDGLDVPIFGGLHGDIPLETTAGALIADVIVDRGISAVLDVSQFESDADKARFARDFAARFFFRKKAAPSAVHVFVEEAQEFIPQNTQKGEEQMLHAWQRMIRLGRNYGIGVSMISQRPQDVNKKALNQAECLFCFQLTGPQERKAVEGWVSDKGLTEDLGRILPDLKVGHAHVWSPVWLDINSEVHIAEKKTFAAGTTPKVGDRPVATKPLAPIELEKIRTDMAATIEKAKADDPRHLKAELARLKSELAKKPVGKTEQKIIEKPIVDEKSVKAVEKIVGRMEAEGNRRVKLAEDLAASGRELSATARSFADAMTKAVGATRAPMRPAPMAREPVARREVAARPPNDGGEIPRGEKAILIAAAQFDGGVERDELSVLAGYKRSSRDAYISRLKEKGYADESGGKIIATDSGIAALGGDYDPLPTGDALRDYWIDRLPDGERKILEVLIQQYPNPVHRDSLDETTGYKRSSRDAYLSRLGSRRLIEVAGRSEVKASDTLFG